jgi:hypothetical protein
MSMSESTRIEYRQPTTASPPGPLAEWWLKPWPWWVWWIPVLLLLLAGAYFGGPPFRPEFYYMWPLIGGFVGLIVLIPLVLAAGVRSVSRWRVARRYGIQAEGLASERKSISRATWGLCIYLIAVSSPLALRLTAAARYSAFESARHQVQNGYSPAGPFRIFPFRFTAAELYDDGIVILYTDGHVNSFPGSGAGFLYLPDGVEFPGYNEGEDGHLIGHWYWFVTD